MSAPGCSCTIFYEATELDNSASIIRTIIKPRIGFCPLHAAADKMLIILSGVRDCLAKEDYTDAELAAVLRYLRPEIEDSLAAARSEKVNA